MVEPACTDYCAGWYLLLPSPIEGASPMDAAQVLAYLHAQRDRIVNAIAALEAM
jgi:hypothetical protein